MSDGTGSADSGQPTGQGSTSGDLGWRAALTPDLQQHASMTKFKGPADLGKAYVELEGKLGTAVQIPGDKATPDERSAFWNKLGRPEKPEGYELTRPELPKGLYWSDGLPQDEKEREKASQEGKVIPYDVENEKQFKQYVHDQGLSKGQAKALWDLYHENVMKAWQEVDDFAAQQRADSDAALTKLWGAQKDGNVELAKRAFAWVSKALGKEEGEAAEQFFRDSGLHNNPTVIRIFHMIGSKFSEDTFVKGGSSNVGTLPADLIRRDEHGIPILNFPSMDKRA